MPEPGFPGTGWPRLISASWSAPFILAERPVARRRDPHLSTTNSQNGRFAVIRNVAYVTHPARGSEPHQLVPIEADPLDWAEQQQLAPLPEDDYPRAELHR